jgi:DNA primase small subunit
VSTEAVPAKPDGAPASAAKPPQPTEFPPAVARTIDWLRTTFAHWYHLHPPPMPDRFTRREFGFMLWPERPGPPPFFRHRAFPTAEGMRDYLARAGPHSAYYSTAYYDRPGELKMADKAWRGAELIFDLDADHLDDVVKAKEAGGELPLGEQLRLVKQQFIRLLDEFLLGDFGLSENDVWITFSGGRGYHAHVVEPRLMQLGSRERREIVDYITGKFPQTREGDVILEPLVRRHLADTKGRGEYAKGVFQVEVPTARSPGWSGRLTRKTLELLEENVLAREPKQARRWLQDLPGVGERRAAKFLEKYSGQVRGRLAGDLLSVHQRMRLLEGELPHRTVLSAEHNVLEEVYKLAATKFSIPMAKGETDEPVTADVKRLIRLPGSLHGKSGLRVVTLKRGDLDGFDPLRDAVAFGMDPVRIVPRKDQEATLGGERVAVKGGEPVEVPMAHAVFWLARQSGTVA